MFFWVAQLLYVPQPPGASREVQWSTYVWRRGTVPIWWGVEIKSGGVGEATIVVSNDKPYRGTRRSVLSEAIKISVMTSSECTGALDVW